MSEWNDWRDTQGDQIELEGADFSEMHLSGANLVGAHLNGANFFSAEMENMRIFDAWLNDAHFEFAKLNKTTFAKSCLKKANFDHSEIQNSFFNSADLEGAKFHQAKLRKTNFSKANLQGAVFDRADLQSAVLFGANLQHASLFLSDCQGTWFKQAKLQGAEFKLARVDCLTTIDKCEFDKKTDFTGVGLDAATIDPALKAALKNNIRRIHWQQWLGKERKKSKLMVPWLWPWPVKWFWWVTDYGSSTKRIIGTFFGLAAVFCLIYWLFAMTPGSQSVIDELRQVPGPRSSTDPITFGCMHTLVRSFYFSVVTMTTLGFGDMHAAKTGGWPSYVGYLLLSVQVLLGYVLLGALITRLGILFTGEAPAAEPRSDKAKSNKDD